MPELPEVETVRRGLEPVLSGRTLEVVEQLRPDLRWPLPERFAQRLRGRMVTALRRRSKWLLMDLDNGETWMVHLGMSGRLLIEGSETVELHHTRKRAGKHDHVVVVTDDGTRVTYNDARRFGAMDLWQTDDLLAHPHLKKLGPEPLSNDFNGPTLSAAFSGRQSPVKAALLDQRTVAGLGNIYVCEALYRARIHPTRRAASIAKPRVAKLAKEIVSTLGEAIEAGGSSLRDYRQADGELGYFQHAFRVYDREGEHCGTEGCGARVRRIVQSGRSTFYCPRCQR